MVYLTRASVLIFILFHIITLRVFNQSYSRTINWEANKQVTEPHTSSVQFSEYLSFKGAIYEDYSTFLPTYSEKLQVSGTSANVKITDITYDTIPREQLQHIVDQQKIPKNLQFRSNLYHSKKTPYLEIKFSPLKRLSNGTIQCVDHFTIQLQDTSSRSSPALKNTKSASYSSNSVLQSGEWFKIKLFKNGIYKLTYDELKEIGIADPGKVRIYGRGGGPLPIKNKRPYYKGLNQIPVYFEDKQADGFSKGDYILFYGKGPTKWEYNTTTQLFEHQKHWYASASYYFITSSKGRGKEVTSISPVNKPADHNVTSFTDFAYHEKDEQNLIASGRKFFESIDSYSSHEYSFSFPHLLKQHPVTIQTKVVARSSQQSTFSFKVNSNPLYSLTVNSVQLSGHRYAKTNTHKEKYKVSTGNLTISLDFSNSVSTASGWLDYILLNAQRALKMHEGHTLFQNTASVASGNVTQFNVANANPQTMIWDVTNQFQVKQIDGTLSADTIKYKLYTDSLRRFAAFDQSSSLNTPVYNGSDDVGKVANQNLHGLDQPDMVIVTLDQFKQQAKELANFHQKNDGLSVVVVEQQKIFNEFSSGAPDAAAIRNFMRMFYDRAGNNTEELPQYLLLFGDGTYKNKGNSENYILTYQNRESINETYSLVTDDFYGLLDENEGGIDGYLDIGIGRFPVNTTSEANLMIEKVKNYTSEQAFGDWKNKICFFSDDQDGGNIDGHIHMSAADHFAQFVDTSYPSFNISKIYADAYQQKSTTTGDRYPEANNMITDQINSGVLLFNYTGHGGILGLTHENILQINDVSSWENSPKLPIFVTASCEVSRYDKHSTTTFGEHILLNDQGGGIALLTTTRLVFANQNEKLNKSFFKHVFEGKNNKKYTFGDINRLTKVHLNGSSKNKRKFALLGDPALKPAYPYKDVVTDSIYSETTDQPTDTVQALEKITVTGHVEENGAKLTDFNGVVYPKIYDKKMQMQTLANEGSKPFTYKTQNNILFNGKASIKNGNFTFTLILPKDINYSYGKGKINYYAENGEKEFRGSYEDFTIGGSVKSITPDNQGPDINLYMNDQNFTSGNITNQSPELLAVITDSSGINTVTQGIGHGITAILEGNNTKKQINLNAYYQSYKDNYKKGTIQYPFSNLEEGDYKLTLKAWDVSNNSNEETIQFTVTQSNDIQLSNVKNYPNPFNPLTTKTEFHFDHNQPNQDLEVMIQIYTVSGRLITTIDKNVSTTGYHVGPIKWNGKNSYGTKIGRGIYLYRLIVRSNNKKAQKVGKIVISR